MTKAPPPLRDDQTAPERLQLSAAAGEESAYDAAQGPDHFNASLAALADTSADDTVLDSELADAVLSIAQVGWGAPSMFLLAALVGLSLFGVLSSASVSTEKTRHSSQTELDTPEAQPSPARPAQESQHLAQVEDRSSPNSAVQREATTAPRPQTAVGVAQHTEIAQLLRARELLRTDATAALVVLQQLAREHPRGVSREERDALTVLALSQSGEAVRARALARRFMADYPNSAMRERLRPLLAEDAQ